MPETPSPDPESVPDDSFVEATAQDVAGQPDIPADQTPYADEEQS